MDTNLVKENGLQKLPNPNLPTLQQLVDETDLSVKENALMVLLNQEPPKAWIKVHPMVKSEYLPINRVEYLLSRIFTKWWVEVRSSQIMANSVAVTVRVYVINPITAKEEWNDGCGAAPIQTNAGTGAADWNNVKSAGVQMALPIAESYAIKDAAEKWGKLFGKDLNRKDVISYDSLLKTPASKEDERAEQMINDAKDLNALKDIEKTLPEKYKDLLHEKMKQFLPEELPDQIFHEIATAETLQNIDAIYKEYATYHNNKEFITLIDKRKAAISKPMTKKQHA